ncbi:MAG: SRPBCC domain-containing protein, partial [Firmicutes bacterium]|nr:SRPBCC domain-containing protein [Bacillota bacterium]
MGIPITGEVGLPAEPLRAFQVLTDPAVLRRAMPGLEELEPAQPEPGEAAGAWYRARLSLGLGPLRERYEGRAAVTDAEPGRFYRLLVRGQGPKGQLELAVEVALEPHPQVEGQTLVRYR